MRILLVTVFFPTGKNLKFTGGVEARTYFVSKYLAKKHQVSIICTRQPGTKKFEVLNGVNIYRIGPAMKYFATGKTQKLFSVLKFVFAAVEKGITLNPNIVEGNNFLSHFIAKQISQKAKTPVTFWYPDVFLGKWVKSSGILIGLAGWLLEKINLARSADLFIAISKTTRDKLIKAGVQKSKISVIACGVDSTEFRLKIKKQKFPTIICVSRLVSYKRVADLIWAFALVHKKIKNLKLTIVGRGPEENKLKEIIKMLKISSHVSFISNLPRKDLTRTIKSADLICLPSETEGFGIAIIESAAAGTPFVASDIEVFKEITTNSKGGILFKLGNIKNLAANIEKLLVDKKLYKQKVMEGQLLAKKYQWSKIASDTEAIYKSVTK